MPASKSPKPEPKVTAWQAIRDIGIALANKDQFYQFAILLVILGLFYLLPADARSQLAFRLLSDFETGSLVGYVLSGIGFVGWALHIVRIKRRRDAEIKRLVEERNNLQERLLKGLIQSSHDMPSPGE